MALFVQGVDAWNKWARENEGWGVNFSNQVFDVGKHNLLFRDFVFPGLVQFDNAEFVGNNDTVSFDKARFCGKRISFTGAKFDAPEISFNHSVFAEKTVVDFSSAIFNGYASFFRAEFHGHGAIFMGTNFNDYRTSFEETKFAVNNVSFANAKIGGDAIFDNSSWITPGTKNHINFTNAECGGDFSMYGAEFNGPQSIRFNGLKVGRSLILDKTRFSVAPDFRNLAVERDVSMHDTEVEFKTHPSKERKKWAENPEHVEMYRKLKSMAVEAKDHEREIEFFAMEERAKRGWRHGWLRYLPTLLYDKVSNFGRSLLRPFIGLAVTWVTSAVAFQWILTKALSPPKLESFLLSAIHLFPFFPWSRGTREDLIRAIIGASENQPTFNAWVEATAYAESFFALAFVFLIGLALRNRFRL